MILARPRLQGALLSQVVQLLWQRSSHSTGQHPLRIISSLFTSLDLQAKPGSFGGGAIYLVNSAASMTYITFQGNSGDSGGGLAATGAAPISMNDCYFNSNSASSTGTGRGGAMFCEFLVIQSSNASRPRCQMLHGGLSTRGLRAALPCVFLYHEYIGPYLPMCPQ